MKIFIDSSAFIALADKTDQYHPQAKEYFATQLVQKTRLITSNFITCETVTYLRLRVSHQSAVHFWENLHQSRLISILGISVDLEEKAFQILKRFKDKDFSFTDCTSFALMESRALGTAFGFDDHFRQFGKFQLEPVT